MRLGHLINFFGALFVISCLLLGSSLASAARGQVFVSEFASLGEYSLSGQDITDNLIPGLNNDPAGIIASDGDLFLLNINQGTDSEYSTSGAPIQTNLITGLNAPYYQALSGNDLFISNLGNGTVGEYTTSGAAVNASLVRNVAAPRGIAVEGNILFVANNTAVAEYNATTGEIINPALIYDGAASFDGLAVQGGNLYVSDIYSEKVEEYTTSGQPINTSFITGHGQTSHIVLAGNLLFADGFDISEYDATTGTLLEPSVVPFEGYSFAVAEAPEPSETLTVLIALVLAVVWRSRGSQRLQPSALS